MGSPKERKWEVWLALYFPSFFYRFFRRVCSFSKEKRKKGTEKEKRANDKRDGGRIRHPFSWLFFLRRFLFT